eukprot:TRINITY_DN2802_c2_g1_i1.p1 TRINITY_DN2802_c2_g1~~TRINITY_DN2802_c2_g1_i1.p1  ORF type:complete len:211 (-),score=51.26 TRINITY_DN2802_c2_g1_i1:177-752(-)
MQRLNFPNHTKTVIKSRNNESFEENLNGALVYIQTCNHSTITLTGRATKIIIENCNQTKIILNNIIIITSICEIINSEALELTISSKLSLITIDRTNSLILNIGNLSMVGNIITNCSHSINILNTSNNCNYLIPEYTHETFAIEYPGLDFSIAQFLTIFNEVSNNLQTTIVKREGIHGYFAQETQDRLNKS